MTFYRARYTVPSNIAIVKYWGKYGNQLPKNTSVSFTLSEAVSDTAIELRPNGAGKMQFYFEGQEKPEFLPKIQSFLNKIKSIVPFVEHSDLKIESSNSFPHSSGIASSASAMGALAMCLCDIESQLFGGTIDLQKASILARLGSGSACRSLYSTMALWGSHAEYKTSSDEYAIPIAEEIHPIFKSYHDDILIVSAKEKSVSSTAGHSLMDTNPFAEVRYTQANRNISKLKSILASGDVDDFGAIAESEAMTLHALMMFSDPSYILMKPNTIEVIEKIRAFRFDTKTPIYFTLDAGPNVHILYPDTIAKTAHDFINQELMQYSENELLINDKVGKGPNKIF